MLVRLAELGYFFARFLHFSEMLFFSGRFDDCRKMIIFVVGGHGTAIVKDLKNIDI